MRKEADIHKSFRLNVLPYKVHREFPRDRDCTCNGPVQQRYLRRFKGKLTQLSVLFGTTQDEGRQELTQTKLETRQSVLKVI